MTSAAIKMKSSRALLAAAVLVGAAGAAEVGASGRAKATTGRRRAEATPSSKTSKATPYYLFGGDCEGEERVEGWTGTRAGYSPYGDRRRDRRRALRAAEAGDDEKAVGVERELDSKCSKSAKSSKLSGSKSSKSKSSKGYTPYPPSSTKAPTKPDTPKPTPKPTTKPPVGRPPVDKEAACTALLAGDVIETDYAAELTYTYEATISTDDRNDPSIEDVTNNMDGEIALLAGTDAMGCDARRDMRRLLEESLVGRRLEELVVVGVSPKPDDVATGGRCATKNEIEGTQCYVINGGMTLYLDNVEPWRRELSAADAMEESTVAALQAIMEAMNQEDSPFLESSGTEYSVDGLVGVRFVSGTTNEGDEVVADDDDNGGDANGATKPPEEEMQTSKMSTAGISLLSLGLIALLALAISMVVLKRRRSNESYKEFEDEGDLDDGQTEPDTLSDRDGKRAYIMGEEGSVYNDTFLHQSYEVGNGNADNQQVDVHHCTSALCPICTGKETVFINAVDDASASPEGSFEYEPKEDVSIPSFDNPAEIERPYVVDDTINF